ncbi:MAG: tRNA-dihydrouridine synthase [Deltaproteobacteria bacterium]|nr:tRNA-dihydrouridine synthase [Deltaproteobacteria bacterium]
MSLTEAATPPANCPPEAPPTGPAIGTVRLRNPFVLAPMAGLTDFPFRRLCLEAGAAMAVTEMVSAVSLAHHGRKTLGLLSTDRGLENPFCVQLFGKDPQALALATRVAVLEAGADIVDLNLACPARKVVRSGHGGALLRDPDLCCRLVEAMAKASPAPVTVKLRPGFLKDDGPSVLDLAPRLEAAGAAAMTLHGRFVSEGFGGQADWSLVGELARQVSVPVIGSGDVLDAWQALGRLAEGGPVAVMIGRAARGRPFVFRECLELQATGRVSGPTLEERLRTAIRHARLIEEEIGPKACFRLRTVLMWYTRELPGAAALRAAICREEDIDAQLDLLRGAMEEAMEAEAGLPPEPPPVDGSLLGRAAPKGGVDSKGQVG